MIGPDRHSNQGKIFRWTMVALVLFSFFWRIKNLSGQSLWRDEVDAIFFALRELPATLSMFVDTGQNGALYFLSLRPWLRLMGSSEFALRFPSVIFGVLAIPLLWQVARKLMPSRPDTPRVEAIGSNNDSARPSRFQPFWQVTAGNAPFLAALFLAFNPYHLWYSQEGKMYSLLTLLALVAAWFWLQGINRGGFWPWLGFLITVSVAMYTHLLMILLLPLFFIWFLLSWPQSKRHCRGYLLSLAGLTLPYLPLLWWQWDMLIAGEQRTAFNFTPLADVLRLLILYQNNSVLQSRHLIFLAPIVLLALAAATIGHLAIFPHARRTLPELTAGRRHILIVSWLIGPVLAIYLVSLRQPVFQPRYVIWIAPATVMLLALGVRLLWQSSGKLARPLATALIIYVLAYWGYVGWIEKTTILKTDLRGVVGYVYERRQTDELLLLQIPHNHHAYEYYSSDQGSNPFDHGDERLGWWSAGISTSPELDIEFARLDVGAQMRWITDGATEIWVVLSEVNLVDPHLLMKEWLDQNMTLIEEVNFQGAQARHYRNTWSPPAR